MKVIHNQITAHVRVDDIVIRSPVTIAEEDPKTHRHVPMRGVVKYVHPLGRFHLVEVGEAPLAVRECFAGVVCHG